MKDESLQKILELSEPSNRKDYDVIYGPKIQIKMGPELIYVEGRGRRAVNRDGELDETPIFDVTMWPQSCKY